MRSDAEVTAAAERTADITLRLVAAQRQVERVRALADEWDEQGREAEAYINRAHAIEIHEVLAEARWFPARAAELRAALDEEPTP